MEDSTSKSQIEFENLVIDNLTYKRISIMSFEEYKEFVLYFFTEVDQLKQKKLRKENIENFIKKHYSDTMSNFDDNDDLFERRFEVFNEELLEFCSSPFFWNTSLETYLKKWDAYFNNDWFKKV